MAETKVTSLKLSEEQRKKIAADLGLEGKMQHVPQAINVVAVRSADFKGTTPGHSLSLIIP